MSCMLRRYVLCNSCKSPDTLLDRDSATRIMFLRCQQVCPSSLDFVFVTGHHCMVDVACFAMALTCVM